MSAATKRDIKRDSLLKALRALEGKCWPPRGALTKSEAERVWRGGTEGRVDLDRAMAGMTMTLWPSRDELSELDFAVILLATTERKKLIPPWKAYAVVNRRWPGIRLVARVEALVRRADKLLKDGESGFRRLKREADAGGPEAIRLRKDLQAFNEGSKNPSAIKWQDYQRDRKCYLRALELIVDELHHQPLLERALPLLKWVAFLGNPAFSDVLTFDDLTRRAGEFTASVEAAETKNRARELARLRKENQRKRANRVKKHKRKKISR
jgi:hypothetical protein